MKLPSIAKGALAASTLLVVSMATYCAPASAVTQEEVMAGAEQLYRKHVAEAAANFTLDASPSLLARVARIARPLIDQARRDYPESATWAWEIHTTTESGESAYCLAGGKLMIGELHARSLALSDTELAMLIAHEMQHALQQHNRKEYDEALRIAPEFAAQPFAALEHAVDHDAALMRKLEPLNFAQEIDADREGLLLAWRAGLPAHGLANYFRKLARASANRNFDSASHPAPARRWIAARELAQTLNSTSRDAVRAERR